MSRSSLATRPWRYRIRIWYRRIVLRSFAYEIVQSVNTTDDILSMLEERVTALEEVLAARWWQLPRVRRRLAAEFRASARQGAHVGGSFIDRRMEAVSEDLAELWEKRRKGAR